MISTAVKHLFFKELGAYFKTPLGYVFLVIFLFGSGYMTFEPGRGSFFLAKKASMTPFFEFLPWLFLFLVPAVSMRLWAEERKSGTIELLLTMPITVAQAAFAKFLASWSFIAIALACTMPMVYTVIYLGNPDLGVAAMGYLAAILTAGTLLAVGGFFSALTKNQVVAFILTVMASFFLLMAGSPPVLEFLSSLLPNFLVTVFESLSILNHYESIERGVLNLSNIWFFVISIGCWFYASVVLLTQNKVD